MLGTLAFTLWFAGMMYLMVVTEDLETAFIVWWTYMLLNESNHLWVGLMLWPIILWIWHKNSMKVIRE